MLQPPPTAPLGGRRDARRSTLEFAIPEAFAAGHHSVAVEVTPDRPGGAPVDRRRHGHGRTIDDVALAVVPSTIRARRRATFRVDIDNRSASPIELELAGEGPELDVRLRPDRVMLRPGERVRTLGQGQGPAPPGRRAASSTA